MTFFVNKHAMCIFNFNIVNNTMPASTCVKVLQVCQACYDDRPLYLSVSSRDLGDYFRESRDKARVERRHLVCDLEMERQHADTTPRLWRNEYVVLCNIGTVDCFKNYY